MIPDTSNIKEKTGFLRVSIERTISRLPACGLVNHRLEAYATTLKATVIDWPTLSKAIPPSTNIRKAVCHRHFTSGTLFPYLLRRRITAPTEPISNTAKEEGSGITVDVPLSTRLSIR